MEALLQKTFFFSRENDGYLILAYRNVFSTVSPKGRDKFVIASTIK